MTLQPITLQQQTLIPLLFSFRYINRLQFQHYLGNQNPSHINRQLKDLVDKAYFRKIEEGSERDYQGYSKPVTYYVGPKGIRFMATLKNLKVENLKNRYRDGTRFQAFIDHNLLLTEIFLQFREKAKENNSILSFQTKTDFEEESTLSRFSPDAYVVEGGEEKKISWLEIVDIEAQRFVLKRRIRSLFKLYSTNSLEVDTGENFPAILLICPTRELQGLLKNYIAKIQEDQGEDIVFKLTTYEKVKTLGVNSKIWKSPKQR